MGSAGHMFPSVSAAVEQFRQSGRSLEMRRICWVTDELIGLYRNGGGGTVVAGFCDALLKAGHDVSVLYTSPADQFSSEITRAMREWRHKGLNLQFLAEESGGIPESLTQRAYAVDRWLRKHEFDIVHFHDFNGSGFAACAAKRTGIAYADTLLCVSNFGTARWAWECMEMYLQSPGELERDWIERRAIEDADVLVCQSQYMAGWLQRNHYVLPPETYVQPSIISLPPGNPGPAGQTQEPIREVVFFARQEVRKGIRLFTEAAEKLSKRHPHLRFTFSGKFSEVDYEHSGAYVFSRLSSIPNDITFLAHLTREQALNHLKGADVLAVMPSIDDNFPGTVIEAVMEGVEFIASDRGGIPEIVHSDNHAERLFPATSTGLANAVERMLKQRPPRPQLAFDSDANSQTWLDWHALVPTSKAAEREFSDPLVSVCLVHYNRPKLLAMAIEGLRQQTYANFEVVLVDDGSTQRDAIAYVNRLESEDLPFKLTVVRTPDIRLGAARNAGVDVAAGEYVIFLDDDNVPRPKMIEALVRGVQRCEFDVATCLAYILTGDAEPDENHSPSVGYFPAGGPISKGVIENVFGDANAITRRSKFLELGGFDPTPGVGAEDWDYFARVVLSGGRLGVVPEPLYWYRQHDQQLTTRWHSTHLYQERLLQTYWKSLGDFPHPEIEDALRLFMGRFVAEKLRTASWYNLGGRPSGEYQRQLLPHVGNVKESYKLLSHLCLDMGRFRDAAKLLLFGDEPYVHLLKLGEEVNQRYSASRPSFPQGYFGETAALEPSIPLLPSNLARVRPAVPPEPPFSAEHINYSASERTILVHPINIPEMTSIAVIDDAFPAGRTKLTASVEVANPAGPEIAFTMMLVDTEAGRELNGFRLPSQFMGKTTVQIGPKDGLHRITVELPEPHDQPLSIILATDAIDSTAFAWATFSNLRVAR